MRSLTTLLIALALLMAPLGSVQASTADEHVETDVTPDRAEVTITNTTDERNATVGLVLDTNEGLLSTNLTVDDGDEHRVDTLLHQLVEYRTDDGDGFDENSTVVSAWTVANESQEVAAESNGTLQWAPLQEENVTADDETEGVLITASALFQDDPVGLPNGEEVAQIPPLEERHVTIELAVFGEEATYEGVDVGPMQGALNVTVNDYPYQGEDTRLALAMEADDQLDLQDIENGTLVASQDLEDSTVSLGLDWDEDALVDGDDVEADADTFEPREGSNVEGQALALSYDQGGEIRQSGTIGASLDEDSKEPAEDTDITDDVPAPSAVAVIAGLGTVALAARRAR